MLNVRELRRRLDKKCEYIPKRETKQLLDIVEAEKLRAEVEKLMRNHTGWKGMPEWIDLVEENARRGDIIRKLLEDVVLGDTEGN